jgi:hypothetical protein
MYNVLGWNGHPDSPALFGPKLATSFGGQYPILFASEPFETSYGLVPFEVVLDGVTVSQTRIVGAGHGNEQPIESPREPEVGQPLLSHLNDVVIPSGQ